MRTKTLIAATLLLMAPSVFAKTRVVTTTEDLAALAREVGGDLAEVQSIARGYQDPHFVEAKPSYLLRLKRADLFIQVGLELEVAWSGGLLGNARNPKILPGNPGFLDASAGCDILEKPQGAVDRSMGDVHPMGNPHYWLDPSNGLVIARNIARRLSELDSAHAADYEANLQRFEKRLAEKAKEWAGKSAPLKGVRVVAFHRSWPNFAKYFSLQVMNFIEPRPGVPPSAAHVQSLMAQIRSDKIRLILVEPYFDEKLPRKIAAETGAALVILPPSVGAEPEIKTYFDLFDYDLNLLMKALAR